MPDEADIARAPPLKGLAAEAWISTTSTLLELVKFALRSSRPALFLGLAHLCRRSGLDNLRLQ